MFRLMLFGESPLTARRLAAFLVIVGVAISGCGAPNNEAQIELTLKSESPGAVVATVKNIGDIDFQWDSEFSVLMKWDVRNKSGTELKESRLSEELEHEKAEVSDRFVTLHPGETVTKEVKLFTSFRDFFYARAYTSDENPVHYPVGGEMLSRFEPDGAHRARVQLEYDGTNDLSLDGFAVCFGDRPESIGLPRTVVKSNSIEVEVAGE
jgi:hypothetical protein